MLRSKKAVTGRPTPAQRLAQSLRDKRAAGNSVRGPRRPPAPRSLPDASPVSEASYMVPVAQGQLEGGRRPTISGAGARDLRVRVRHREFIADLTGAGASTYSATSFSINPGLPGLFPWLSSFARSFESYKFNSLSFEWRTTSPTSSSGKVILSVDWDASDSTPASKIEQMQERTKADGVSWMSFKLNCDRADLLKLPQRYIRTGSVSSTDVKLYDVGNFIAATVMGATNTGELHVEYDVELITPNPTPAPVSGKIVAGGSVSNAALFGTVPVQTGSVLVSAATNTLTFTQIGKFFVELSKTGTTLIATPNTGTATSVDAAAVVVNTAGTSSLESWTVNVTASGQTLILNPSGDASVSASTLRIAQYDVSLA